METYFRQLTHDLRCQLPVVFSYTQEPINDVFRPDDIGQRLNVPELSQFASYTATQFKSESQADWARGNVEYFP